MSATGPTSGPPAWPDGATAAGVPGRADRAAVPGKADGPGPGAEAGHLPGPAGEPRPDGPHEAASPAEPGLPPDPHAQEAAHGGIGYPWPADLDDEPAAGSAGAVLSGRYRLEQRIAAGGMGEVWRANDEVLGRQVAVKLLRHAYVGDRALASRFRAEARYAAALSHPGIAQVFDYGEQVTGPGGGAYLVMELVPGEPLSAILARTGPLSVRATLDIVAQAAAALQAAHAAGIVHRDIKPGNLLVTADGRVKITDFGIARAAQAAQAGHLTQTGMVMGTAQYVSPEQASGLQVTHASDIYSLGVVAYECLVGSPPFAADAVIAIALAHVRDAPPPLPPETNPLVSDMVMRMLAKAPEDRPKSAHSVAQRAVMLRDSPPAAPGLALADVATSDAGSWSEERSAASPEAHATTTQLPAGGAQHLPWARRLRARHSALVLAGLSAAILAVAGVTTALMVNSHHAATTNGSGGRPSPAATASSSPTPRTVPSTSASDVPVVIPPTQPAAPQPSATVSATPSQTPSASASATPTATPTATLTPTPSPTIPPTPTPTPSPT